MKTTLLLYLIVFGPISALANESRRECKAEYRDCLEDVETELKKIRDEVTDGNTEGSPSEVISAAETLARTNRVTCYRMKRDCFDDCRAANQSFW